MTDRHEIQPYPIRMPAKLRTRLEASAKADSRSLHSEILDRLTASFDDASSEDLVATLKKIQALTKRAERLAKERGSKT